MRKNSLVVSGIILMIFNILSKITGFFRETTLAYYYGATNITDAYVASTTVFLTVFTGIVGAAMMGYITVAVGKREDTLRHSYITSNIINIFGLATIALSIIGMVFSKELTFLFAGGFDTQTLNISADMVKYMLPFSVFYAYFMMADGYLRSKEIFWFGGISFVIMNIGTIISIIISNNSVLLLGGGYGVALALPAGLAYYLLKRQKYKYKPIINFRDADLKLMVKLAVPIFIGQLFSQLNTVVDRNFSSGLGGGVMSALGYAHRIDTLFVTFFVSAIAAVIFPSLIKHGENIENNLTDYKDMLAKALNTVMLISIIVGIGIFVLSQDIVEVVYMRGAFDQAAADMTANALRYYTVGMPALSLVSIIINGFYSLKDTKTPIICGIVSLMLNIGLNFLLVNRFGYIGLAVATSVSSIVLALLLFIFLRKKISGMGIKYLLINFIKMVIGAIAAGIVVFYINRMLMPVFGETSMLNKLLVLSLDAVLGATTYFAITAVLKVPEVKLIWNMINEKIISKLRNKLR